VLGIGSLYLIISRPVVDCGNETYIFNCAHKRSLVTVKL
jgi:hypothetical protein